jgi:hypothetical protein
MVAAAFVSAPAAILPTNARAEDGPAGADSAAAAAAGTGVDVAVPTESDAVSAADDAVASALAATGLDASATADAQSDPAAEGSTAEPTVSPDPAGVEQDAEMSAVKPDATVDTTTTAADTTPDTVGSAPVATETPVAVQTAPANVNVSVRIGSAGDNGPVTQTNLAEVVSTGTQSAAAAPIRAGTAAAPPMLGGSAAAQATGTAPAAAAEDDEDTWSWQWDCVSAPAISMISPGGSSATSTPRNWTWIWNCGGNDAQYHGTTAAQYQPSNVNVSIRIASPGNDGPVSQANVAIAVSAGVSVPHGASTPAQAGTPSPAVLPIPIPVVSLPGIVQLPSLPSLAAVLSPVVPSLVEPSIESGVTELVSSELGPLADALDGVDALTPVTPPTVGARGVPSWALLTPRRPPLGFGSSLGPGTTVSARGVAWGGGVAAARPSSASEHGPATRDPKRAKPAPRWRKPAPATPPPAQAPPGASAAAAGGGGSSGGGLPFLLALPFAAAMLDLARRVALERVATPSGHRSRMPENPG